MWAPVHVRRMATPCRRGPQGGKQPLGLSRILVTLLAMLVLLAALAMEIDRQSRGPGHGVPATALAHRAR